MSQERAQQFSRMVEKDSVLLQKIVAGATGADEVLERVVAEGKRQGFEFTTQEAKPFLKEVAPKPAGELSDNELDAVSGGATVRFGGLTFTFSSGAG